jgi:hypothetical protein
MILPGSVYATGSIAPYIASYYKVPISATSNILPTFFAVNAFCVPIGSYFAQNFHWPRIQLTIGISVGIGVLFLATISTKFWLFFVLYVIGFCLIQATCYLVAIHQGWLWFNNRRPGLVSGIIIGGYGMSAVMLDPITLDLANPWHDNFDKTTNQYPERVNARFEYMMHIVLLIFVGLAVVGIGLTF